MNKKQIANEKFIMKDILDKGQITSWIEYCELDWQRQIEKSPLWQVLFLKEILLHLDELSNNLSVEKHE